MSPTISFSKVAFSKDAFPNRRRPNAPATKSFCPLRQAQFSCVGVQAQ